MAGMRPRGTSTGPVGHQPTPANRGQHRCGTGPADCAVGLRRVLPSTEQERKGGYVPRKALEAEGALSPTFRSKPAMRTTGHGPRPPLNTDLSPKGSLLPNFISEPFPH